MLIASKATRQKQTARVLGIGIGMRLKSHGLAVPSHCKASDDDPTQIKGYFGFIHEAAVACLCLRARTRSHRKQYNEAGGSTLLVAIKQALTREDVSCFTCQA